MTENISWYVKHLINWNYTPSIVWLAWIKINYEFILNSIDKDSQILEIWPWNWFFIDFLIMNWYQNITYIDLDDTNVETLTEKYKNIKAIKWFSGDWIIFLKNTNQKFDLIVSRQVLEHLDSNDVRNYFKYSHKCLTNWWILITETINSQNIIYWNLYRYIDSTHKNSFTEKSLKEYGGDEFLQYFHEYYNFWIIDMIKIIFNKNIKQSYKSLLNTINIKQNTIKNKKDNKQHNYKKYFMILRLIYYKRKSKRLSKKYLSWIDPSATVFTDIIISVGKFN